MVAAIKKIRKKTSKGTINLNSNGSIPTAVVKLAESGLDSIRISINSTREIYHNRYYRPKGFSLADVRHSIRIMKDFNRHVSLNYFILPGFTDDPAEFQALQELIKTDKPDLIQLRNLNIDPEFYLQSIDFKPSGSAMGMLNWHKELIRSFPELKLGYFNPFLGE
jgi:wyosine [tRNA(Phe)-imidazoG37] synthetase (radical SAM superfamily)